MVDRPKKARYSPEELRTARIERLRAYQWKKGQTGNPNGSNCLKRAISLRQELRERFGDNAAPLVARLEAELDNKDPRVRIEASKLLLGYHSGTPQQSIELSGQTVGARTVQIVLQPSSGVVQPLAPADVPLALPPADPSTA